MDLSICIVSYEGREKLRACLESIRANRPSVEHEVIVVDNGSHELPGAPTAGSSCRSGGQIYHRCSYCQNTA